MKQKVDMNKLQRTVMETGRFLSEQFGSKSLEITYKTRKDLVSDADKKAENMLIKALRSIDDIKLLSEEFHPDEKTTSSPMWIIDPLDGTTNYLSSIPLYAVSVAHYDGETIDCSACYIPSSGEYFSAIKGEGAYCNGVPVKVSSEKNIIDAVVATGFADLTKDMETCSLEIFHEIIKNTRAVRRMGSAVVDLLYTAVGRFDFFWEWGLSPWDVAAGGLIVSEAGGIVTDYKGGDNWVSGGTIIASNKELYKYIFETVTKKMKTQNRRR
ncbi:MAG: inositol monophosphatase family protein [bacterium]